MESRLDLLSKDILFKLALELPLPDLLTFCSNARVNQLVCSRKEIWLAKLKSDFGDYQFGGTPNDGGSKETVYQMLKTDPRENY